MSRVKITAVNQLDEGWLFEVAVDDKQFEVGLGRDYYQRLTNGAIEPEELVQRSFRFLLEREPVGAILSRFELPTIQKYFPEYEAEISLDNE